MADMGWFDRNLKSINRVLLVFIIIINGYVLLTPLLPQASFYVEQAFSEPINLSTEQVRSEIDKSYNHLIIPGISLDEDILVGDNEWLVNKGVWQVPHTSTPDQGSNTVLVGHRFSYSAPSVFYHLDKIDVGEQIAVAWNKKLYTYEVSQTKIVAPTDTYVEDGTEDSQLTLYTCHPLWSTRQRLVVIAKLDKIE